MQWKGEERGLVDFTAVDNREKNDALKINVMGGNV